MEQKLNKTKIKFEVDEAFPQYDWRNSPWGENRKFGYLITKYLKPKLIVELGTYYGCSFFTFCQAVKDYKLKTKLIAIDTWEGDEHSGFYGQDVFSTFDELRYQLFVDKGVTATAWRTDFDDAFRLIRNYHPGMEIGILHIDGLHTYEAVKHDYETWLPLLAEDGIVIFHDTNVERFGVKKFYEELQKDLPSITFKNVNGLGVIAPKAKGISVIKRIEENVIKKEARNS